MLAQCTKNKWWGSFTRRRKGESNPQINTFGVRVRLAPATRAMAAMQHTSTSDCGERFSETPARPWNEPLLSWRHSGAVMTPGLRRTWQPRCARRRPGQAGLAPCRCGSSAAGLVGACGGGRVEPGASRLGRCPASGWAKSIPVAHASCPLGLWAERQDRRSLPPPLLGFRRARQDHRVSHGMTS